MNYCSKCEEELPSNGLYVKCEGCKSLLHNSTCCTISEKTYKGMSRTRKEEWRCELCRMSTKLAQIIEYKLDATILEPLLTPLKATLNKMNNQLEECINRQTFISEKYEELSGIQNNMISDINKLKQDIKSANENANSKDQEIELISNQLNKLNQEQLNKDAVIYGLVEKPDENLNTIINNVFKKANMDANNEDITKIYRINNKNNGTSTLGTRPVIVKFKNAEQKKKLINNKKKIIIKNNEVNNVENNQEIKIFDRLTPTNKKLLYLAKGKAAENQWKFVWFADSTIKCRKSEGSKIFTVKTEADIEKIRNN